MCQPEPEVDYCDDDPTVVDDRVDVNGNGTSDVCEDEDEVVIPVINTPTCPDGSALPMTDVNGDGQINAVDCNEVLPAVVSPDPKPATPATPATLATPATPVEPAPSVLPTTLTRVAAPAAVAPAQVESAVLGAQVQRAPLARTGSSSAGIAAFGVLLLALGASSTLMGRRAARS